MEIYWYVINLAVTLISGLILILIFVPRFLITILVRLAILVSKFRYKKYLRLEKNKWACYLERGSIEKCKTSILFLHGLSGSGVDYVGILPKLDPNIYHVVALDLLNHGSSTCLDEDVAVEDMVHFIKKFVAKVGLHRRKFHLVSFSMSTAPAIVYSTKYPDDLASLTLAAPPCRVSPEIPEMLTFKNEDEILNMLDIMSSNKMKHPPSLVVRALVHHKNYVAPNVSKVLNGMKKFKFPEELLKKVSVNTFVLCGDIDKVCLIEGVDYLKENVKNCTVHIIKDCGHVMFFTHVKEVAENLIGWLSKQTEEKVVRRSQGLKPSMQW